MIRVFFEIGAVANTPWPCTPERRRTILGSLTHVLHGDRTSSILTTLPRCGMLPSSADRRDGRTMEKRDAPDLLPGTLDLLILNALASGTNHGYGIAQRLKAASDDVLQVGESSLYPALQRLLLKGWAKADWGASENNSRARYYTLTAAGRKRLAAERSEFDRLILAIHKVL